MSKLSEHQRNVLRQLDVVGEASMRNLRTDGRTISSLLGRDLICRDRTGLRYLLTDDGRTVVAKLDA